MCARSCGCTRVCLYVSACLPSYLCASSVCFQSSLHFPTHLCVNATVKYEALRCALSLHLSLSSSLRVFIFTFLQGRATMRRGSINLSVVSSPSDLSLSLSDFPPMHCPSCACQSMKRPSVRCVRVSMY